MAEREERNIPQWVSRYDLERAIDGLRDMMNERHLRHELHFQAQERAEILALESMEKLMASEKEARNRAIEKADAALVEYKLASNNIMHRPEITTNFDGLEKKIEEMRKEIQNLRESRSEGGGRGKFVQDYLPVISIIVAVCAIIFSVLMKK